MVGLEFRSCVDDAWYYARTVMDGRHRLRVKFIGFPHDNDEVYDAKELSSFNDIDEFRCRFRPVSVQVQDSECSEVGKGMVVCAAHSVCPDDRRFYDAVVNKVVRREHRFVKGEEECSCSFILFWRHGPKAGSLTSQALENICRVQPCTRKMDPFLISFLKTAREKIEITLSNVCTLPHEAAYDSKTCRRNYRHKLSISQHSNQDTSTSRQPSSLCSSFKDMAGNPSQRAGHDIDMEEGPHMIIIDNLEKGLSPLKIAEFIHYQVSISCQAFVSPSISTEWYTRGTILLDCKKNVDKLSDFLESPDHIIVSPSGRPWVMTEKTRVHETLRAPIENFKLISQKILESRRTGTSNELKVVVSGTEEYRKAKLLKDLFWEFSNHQLQLHQRLLTEEGKIWQLSDAA